VGYGNHSKERRYRAISPPLRETIQNLPVSGIDKGLAQERMGRCASSA